MAAAFEPGAIVREIARRADVTPSLIYRWRRDLRAEAGFAQVVVAGSEIPTTSSEPPVEIEFAGSIRVRVPASIPPALAAAIVEALARR